MTPLTVRSCLVLAALTLVAAAGFTDWALLLPDDPFAAFLGASIAGGLATAALLPFMLT